MTRKDDGWSVILAGFWNRAIFLPKWALPRLFPHHESQGHEVQTEVALLQSLPLIYRDPQVLVEISGGYLSFRPQVFTDECLLRCERMARDMIEALPQTPLHWVGINFAYREELPLGSIPAMFNDPGDAELAQRGWRIVERRSMRTISYEGDFLKLATTLGTGIVDFDFNFYSEFDGAVAEKAKRTLEEGRIIRLRDVALGLLSDVYHLEIEEENVPRV